MLKEQTENADLAAVIKTSQRNYRVLVGRGILSKLPREMRLAGLKRRAFVVADHVMFPKVARAVQDTLETDGFPAHLLAIPSGESIKTLDTAQHIYEWLSSQRAERGDAIVAVGGGVTGDIVGFAAATWLRGVPIVQVPTTLAAMVDASLGGKVAVNLPAGKNLDGAFHQPWVVLSDIDLLDTLPQRELAAGWAEAIKHGLILDMKLLDSIERNVESLLDLDGPLAVQVIRQSVAIKADVVSSDEFETGDMRVLLNYGHTIGHAIEAVTGFGKFLHGEAVSVGMMGAAKITARLGMIDPELVERQRALLESFGLPLRAPGLSADAVLAATRSDKKTRGGSVRWVLLEALGSATTRSDVPSNVVAEVVRELVEPE